MSVGNIVIFLPCAFVKSDAGQERSCHHVVDGVGASLGGSVAVVHGEVKVSDNVVHDHDAGVAGTGHVLFLAEVEVFLNPDDVTVRSDEVVEVQGAEEAGDAFPVVGCFCRQVRNLVF